MNKEAVDSPFPMPEGRVDDATRATPCRNLETPQSSLGTKEVASEDGNWNFSQRSPERSNGKHVPIASPEPELSVECEECDRGSPVPCLAHIPAHSLELTLANDGEGGTYFATSKAKETYRSLLGGDIVGVFKPSSEEIGCAGNPRGNADLCRVDGFEPGTGAVREVAAYELDHFHRANVPLTVFKNFPGKGRGSMQAFIPNLFQSWNMSGETRSKIRVTDLQYLALFDIRVLNTDRHGGNILVNSKTGQLWAIDHSYILPPRFVDPEWDWTTWPESKHFIDDRVRRFFVSLDDARDLELLRSLGIEDDACDLFLAASTALKFVLSSQVPLSLRRVAEFFRRTSMTFASPFEECVAESRGPLNTGAKIDFALLKTLLHAKVNSFVLE